MPLLKSSHKIQGKLFPQLCIFVEITVPGKSQNSSSSPPASPSIPLGQSRTLSHCQESSWSVIEITNVRISPRNKFYPGASKPVLPIVAAKSLVVQACHRLDSNTCPQKNTKHFHMCTVLEQFQVKIRITLLMLAQKLNSTYLLIQDYVFVSAVSENMKATRSLMPDFQQI